MPLPAVGGRQMQPQQQPMMPQMQPPQQQMPQQQANVENLLSQLAAAGYPVHTKADLERLFASDPYEEVLVVMAEVRAYWQVAYKASCHSSCFRCSPG